MARFGGFVNWLECNEKCRFCLLKKIKVGLIRNNISALMMALRFPIENSDETLNRPSQRFHSILLVTGSLIGSCSVSNCIFHQFTREYFIAFEQLSTHCFLYRLILFDGKYEKREGGFKSELKGF